MNSVRRHNQARDPKRNIDPLDMNPKTFRKVEIAKNIYEKVVKDSLIQRLIVLTK